MPLLGEIVVIKRNGTDGTHFPLTANSCTFGREKECDIRIQLPHVSREHCKIEVNENKEAILTNLSTANPTQLNGNNFQQPVCLKHGDILTILDRSFRFEYPLVPLTSQTIAKSEGKETLQVLHVQQVEQEKLQPPNSDCKSLLISDEKLKWESPKTSGSNEQRTQDTTRQNKFTCKIRRSGRKRMSSFGTLHECMKHDAKRTIRSSSDKISVQQKVEYSPTKDSIDVAAFLTPHGISASDQTMETEETEKVALENFDQPTGTENQEINMIVSSPMFVEGNGSKTSTSDFQNYAAHNREETNLLNFQHVKENEVSEVIKSSNNDADRSSRCFSTSHSIVTLKYEDKSRCCERSISLSTEKANIEVKTNLNTSVSVESVLPRSKVGGESLETSSSPSSRQATGLLHTESDPLLGLKSTGEISTEIEEHIMPMTNREEESGVLTKNKYLKSNRNNKLLDTEQLLDSQILEETKTESDVQEMNMSNQGNIKKEPAVQKSRKKRKGGELDLSVQPLGKRKRVSFGGHLSPELFDKRLPPNSPLKRGAIPAKFSLPFKNSPRAVLKKASGFKQCVIKGFSEKDKQENALSRKESPAASPNVRARDVDVNKGVKTPETSDQESQTAQSARKSNKFVSKKTSLHRRSGAKRQSVSRSWAEVVKQGVPKLQQRTTRKRSLGKRPAKKMPTKAPKSNVALKTPTRKVKGYFTTGHANSPAPIVVGKAHTNKVNIAAQVPKVAFNSTLKQHQDTNESFTGEMTAPPLNLSVQQIYDIQDVGSPILRNISQISTGQHELKVPGGGNFALDEIVGENTMLVTGKTVAIEEIIKDPKEKSDCIEAHSETTSSSVTVEIVEIGDIIDPEKKSDCIEAHSGTTSSLVTVETVEIGDIIDPEKSNCIEEHSGTTSSPVTAEAVEMGEVIDPEKKSDCIKTHSGTTSSLVTVETVEIGDIIDPEKKSDCIETHSGTMSSLVTVETVEIGDIIDPEKKSDCIETHLGTMSSLVTVETVEIVDIIDPEKKSDCIVAYSETERLLLTPKKEPELVKELLGSKRPLSTLEIEPVDALSGVKRLCRTPKQGSDLVEVLSGSKRPVSTLEKEPLKAPRVKRLPRTPQQKLEQADNLSGVSRLFQISKQKPKPVDTLSGSRSPLKTPKQKEVEDLSGVSRLFQTPRPKPEPVEDLSGVSRLFQTPRPKPEPVEDLSGVSRLFRTPRPKPEPVEDLSGVSRLFQTHEPKPESVEIFSGDKRLLNTPKQKLEPIEALSGIKGQFKMPKQKTEPVEDMIGISRILKTPKLKFTPVDDYLGLQRLMAEPKQNSLSDEIDFTGVKELFGPVDGSLVKLSESVNEPHEISSNEFGSKEDGFEREESCQETGLEDSFEKKSPNAMPRRPDDGHDELQDCLGHISRSSLNDVKGAHVESIATVQLVPEKDKSNGMDFRSGAITEESSARQGDPVEINAETPKTLASVKKPRKGKACKSSFTEEHDTTKTPRRTRNSSRAKLANCMQTNENFDQNVPETSQAKESESNPPTLEKERLREKSIETNGNMDFDNIRHTQQQLGLSKEMLIETQLPVNRRRVVAELNRQVEASLHLEENAASQEYANQFISKTSLRSRNQKNQDRSKSEFTKTNPQEKTQSSDLRNRNSRNQLLKKNIRARKATSVETEMEAVDGKKHILPNICQLETLDDHSTEMKDSTIRRRKRVCFLLEKGTSETLEEKCVLGGKGGTQQEEYNAFSETNASPIKKNISQTNKMKVATVLPPRCISFSSEKQALAEISKDKLEFTLANKDRDSYAQGECLQTVNCDKNLNDTQMVPRENMQMSVEHSAPKRQKVVAKKNLPRRNRSRVTSPEPPTEKGSKVTSKMEKQLESVENDVFSKENQSERVLRGRRVALVFKTTRALTVHKEDPSSGSFGFDHGVSFQGTKKENTFNDVPKVCLNDLQAIVEHIRPKRQEVSRRDQPRRGRRKQVVCHEGNTVKYSKNTLDDVKQDIVVENGSSAEDNQPKRGTFASVSQTRENLTVPQEDTCFQSTQDGENANETQKVVLDNVESSVKYSLRKRQASRRDQPQRGRSKQVVCHEGTTVKYSKNTLDDVKQDIVVKSGSSAKDNQPKRGTFVSVSQTRENLTVPQEDTSFQGTQDGENANETQKVVLDNIVSSVEHINNKDNQNTSDSVKHVFTAKDSQPKNGRGRKVSPVPQILESDSFPLSSEDQSGAEDQVEALKMATTANKNLSCRGRCRKTLITSSILPGKKTRVVDNDNQGEMASVFKDVIKENISKRGRRKLPVYETSLETNIQLTATGSKPIRKKGKKVSADSVFENLSTSNRGGNIPLVFQTSTPPVLKVNITSSPSNKNEIASENQNGRRNKTSVRRKCKVLEGEDECQEKQNVILKKAIDKENRRAMKKVGASKTTFFKEKCGLPENNDGIPKDQQVIMANPISGMEDTSRGRRKGILKAKNLPKLSDQKNNNQNNNLEITLPQEKENSSKQGRRKQVSTEPKTHSAVSGMKKWLLAENITPAPETENTGSILQRGRRKKMKEEHISASTESAVETQTKIKASRRTRQRIL